MTNNKNQIDRIHDQLPKYFRTRQNPNWKALIEALGESDQDLADLVEQVKKQMFVNTASRPYIDRLGANSKVARPRFVGMQDEDFRKYIPVLAYQPKQVKLIMDSLLDIFFFKETTTAFTQSENSADYALEDGWELLYKIDQIREENIIFRASDFTNINSASAEEVVSAINRQANYSFAIVFDDRIKKRKFIRLFSNTIGAKGSVQIVGGRADLAFKFAGFNNNAGASVGTVWNITKIGDKMTFQHTGGPTPNLNKVQIGDIAIIEIPNNAGSFVITDINISSSSFSFINLFGTPGTHTIGTTTFVNFITPLKQIIYNKDSRSVVWEVSPGQIIVEMPASPPVVKRSLAGSAHINGMVSSVVDTPSATSLELQDASDWPLNGGKFVLQEIEQIQTHVDTISEDVVLEHDFNSRFNKKNIYTYTGKTGNTLTGITPNLPALADVYEKTITTAIRSGSVVTITTSSPHGFKLNENVYIQDTVADATINGSFIITSIPSSTSFTYTSLGAPGTNTGGVARVERIGMANSGSLAYLTSAQLDTGIIGPYMWDLGAAFVLSSLTSTIQAEIFAGSNVRTLPIASPNNIENTESFAIFDFGTEKQEGPVRLLYKPTANSVQVDPAYIFKYSHDVGSSITVIRKRGAITMSGLGKEYAAYITDPSVARQILQNLLLQVKSVGIFIEFLIRYPQQIYSVLDVYQSGDPALWPIGQP